MLKLVALFLFVFLATCWAQHGQGGGGISSQNEVRGRGQSGNRYRGGTSDRSFKYNVAYDNQDQRDYPHNPFMRGGFPLVYGYPGSFGYGPIEGYGAYGPPLGGYGAYVPPQGGYGAFEPSRGYRNGYNGQFQEDYEHERGHSGPHGGRPKKRGKHSKLNRINDNDDD